MATGTYIITNFPETARRTKEAALRSDAVIAAELPLTALALERAVIPIIVAYAPVGTGPDHDADNSLASRVDVEATVTSKAATLVFRDFATSKKNWDGSGGGAYYAYWVINGRGAITAPSNGPYSTGKKALRLPWGAFKSVKAAPANDFPKRALEEASQAVIPVTLGIGGTRMAVKILDVMGGKGL